MGYAYTPGLTVAESTVIRKVRRLPIAGEVLVRVGQAVAAEDVVAQTSLPGEAKPINVVAQLGISGDELPNVLLKREGEPVAAGELFAQTRGLFGLFKSECRSPLHGTLESISSVTGQVILRGRPTLLQKNAYAQGTVVAVQEGESATVEIHGTFVQGIFGVGGEAGGPLEVVVDAPDDELSADRIRPEHAGKILVGGSLVTAEAVRRAIELKIKGLVSGGLNDADLRDFLGYELGVAITGEEQLGLTLVITEGFGPIHMARRTFDLLKQRHGMLASINGATQIRAGVIRPEVVIPLAAQAAGSAAAPRDEDSVLQVGTALRAIRDPYFGRIGRCTKLPVELVRLPSETQVRVLEVEFEDGARAILPRANVELIKD